MAAVARPLASVQPERKTPPRAGLKYWDERTQRVVELVPPAQCPTSREVPLVHKKFLTAGTRRGRMKSRRQRGSLKHSSLKVRRSDRTANSAHSREGGNPGPIWVPPTAKARLRASVTRYASRGAPRGDERKAERGGHFPGRRRHRFGSSGAGLLFREETATS